MKRREFFGALGSAAVVASIPMTLQAAECSEELPVDSEITNNHGHDVDLDIKRVMQLLRETKENGPVNFDIQGSSGHPHAIRLSHDTLLKLLVDGEIEETSSNVAGHTHGVLITLTV